MENYRKSRVEEQPSVCPFPRLPPDTPQVRVKDGSKIRNLLRFALSRMEPAPQAAEDGGGQEGAGQQEACGGLSCGHIVFTATGTGVSKAITCAEIVKRRVKGLHQLTRLLYAAVVEVWEPLEPAAGLDSLNVSRNVPAIWILLSREPMDRDQPGYQAPGRYDALWAQSAIREEGGGVTEQRPGHKRKRGGGGGRGRGSSRQSGRSREAGQKGQS